MTVVEPGRISLSPSRSSGGQLFRLTLEIFKVRPYQKVSNLTPLRVAVGLPTRGEDPSGASRFMAERRSGGGGVTFRFQQRGRQESADAE